MELTTAMLADAAEVNQQTGKLFVHGGHWSRIFAPSFPVTHPTLSVVLILDVSYDEAMEEHTIELALEKDGVAIGPRAKGVLQTGHAPDQVRGAPASVPLAFPFQGITFPEAGRYEWRIHLDGVPVRSLPLDVNQVPSLPGMQASQPA